MIFISIPRVASNSIRKALNLNDGTLNHRSSKVIDGDGFRFCFIRNPYERLVSWFEWHRQWEPLVGEYNNDTFKTWVEKGCPTHWDESMLTACGISDPLNQHEFIDSRIDFIGTYEKLHEDFDYVCKVAGIDTPQLPRLMYTTRLNYESYYNETLQTIVSKIFPIDIELWHTHKETKKNTF